MYGLVMGFARTLDKQRDKIKKRIADDCADETADCKPK